MTKTIVFSIFIFLLFLIHFVDMELTLMHVGNNPNLETFAPMKYAIGTIGIYNAIWVSKIIAFTYFYIAWLYRNSTKGLALLVLFTVLYYSSMVNWLFSLHILNWPFPN